MRPRRGGWTRTGTVLGLLGAAAVAALVFGLFLDPPRGWAQLGLLAVPASVLAVLAVRFQLSEARAADRRADPAGAARREQAENPLRQRGSGA